MELNKLLQLAIEVSKEAGEEIIHFYKKELSQHIKADGSPLTLADSASHELISKRLLATKIPIVSEEGSDLLLDQDLYWLVDPLDGTKDFLAMNDEFTVNIALISNNKPVLGVVYAPASKELYAGIPDTKTLQFENVTSVPSSEVNLRMGVSRFHDHEDVDVFAQMNGITHKIQIGSALKYGRLAKNLIDVFPRLVGSSEWDTAAGQAVVEAADGQVLDWNSGAPLRYGKAKRRNPRLLSLSSSFKYSDFELKKYKDELL